jgi:uncharacterized protein YbjT (DUF2867 family)
MPSGCFEIGVAARIVTEPGPHAGKTYTLTGGEALAAPDRLRARSGPRLLP